MSSLYESPCHGCTEEDGRSSTCHADCQRYAKYRILNELRRRREKKIENVRKAIVSPAYIKGRLKHLKRIQEGRK